MFKVKFISFLLILCNYNYIISQDNTSYHTDAAPGNTGDKVSFFGKWSGSNNSGNASSVFGARADNAANNSGDSISHFGYAWQNKNSGDFNSIFGSNSGGENESGVANTFFGHRAGYRNISGFHNTYLGRAAGSDVTRESRNTIIGAKRFEQNISKIWSNVMIGNEVAYQDTAGRQNTFVGHFSAFPNLRGYNNTFLGAYSGDSNTEGFRNTLLGVFSDVEDGDFNTLVGFGSSCGNCLHNVLVGSFTKMNEIIAHNNVALGYRAGEYIGGNDNIFIGANIGILDCMNDDCNEFVFNTLRIDIEKTNLPLIYANFNTNEVRVNGEFEVSTGLYTESDIELKSDIKDISTSDILQRVRQLPIYRWSYIVNPTVDHIGPMAQDFQRIFQLSNINTSIPLVDMDGIKLASIKELTKRQDNVEIAQSNIENKQAEIKKELQAIKDIKSEIEEIINAK